MLPRPYPFISVNIENEYKENGEIKKSKKVITAKGKIFSWDGNKDSPDYETEQPKDEERLGIIHTRYQAVVSELTHLIGNAFASSPFQVPFGGYPVKLKSQSYQIDAGNTYADYTITAEQVLFQRQEVDESWSLDPADEYDRFVKITRTRSVSLEAESPEDDNPSVLLDKAMALVAPSNSFDAPPVPSPISASISNAYNKTTVYSVNTEKISVECTESWMLCGESSLVDDSFTIKEGSETAFKSASRQISIKGLEGASGGSKYANALSKLGSLGLDSLSAGDGYTIGSVSGKVRSIARGKNEVAGTCTVSIEVSEGIEQDGELLRTVDVTDTKPSDFYASIPAVGKSEGPILQQFGTTKQGTKTVNLTVLYKNGIYKVPDVNDYAPDDGAFFVDKDEISYDERSGRITRNVVWVYGGTFA